MRQNNPYLCGISIKTTIMRRLFQILATMFALVAIYDASAQQVVKQRVGVYKEDGNVVVAEATTTLVVDLVVEHTTFTAGPYARYAQKLLGTRASLVDRDEYELVKADVGVLQGEAYYADRREAMTHNAPVYMGYSPLPIDRMSSVERGTESAATEAAEHIFLLRRSRLDLITGELGDGVYGGGLESALREIDRMEQAYLELFYGKSETSVESQRVVIPVDAEQKTTIIARFNHEDGIVAKSDLTGDIVMVVITPMAMSLPQSDIKGTVAYRYANNAEVKVVLGQEVLTSRILPIYEFGETVMFLQPQR